MHPPPPPTHTHRHACTHTRMHVCAHTRACVRARAHTHSEIILPASDQLVSHHHHPLHITTTSNKGTQTKHMVKVTIDEVIRKLIVTQQNRIISSFRSQKQRTLRRNRKVTTFVCFHFSVSCCCFNFATTSP